jgi:RNA polymerase sigma-70 factor, ECF subfamily
MTEPSRSDKWSSLVHQHSSGLYRVALQMIGDRVEAEDVVQETFLRAYVAMERRGFVIHTSVKAWLSRIAINLCYDRLRRKSWHELPTETTDELAIHSNSAALPGWSTWSESDPEHAVLQQDQASQIRRAMAALSPNHRAAVVLRYAYDLSYREIAAALDVPENTVATWLRRAHLAMRRELTEEDSTPCRATARA